MRTRARARRWKANDWRVGATGLIDDGGVLAVCDHTKINAQVMIASLWSRHSCLLPKINLKHVGHSPIGLRVQL